MAARLGEATGLSAEQRATGLALMDESAQLTDVAMPAVGTASHVTLLLAEFLVSAGGARPAAPVSEASVRALIPEYERYWAKAAREPGGETELASNALARLAMLRLIRRDAGGVYRCRRARFALGGAELVARKATVTQGAEPAQDALF